MNLEEKSCRLSVLYACMQNCPSSVVLIIRSSKAFLLPFCRICGNTPGFIVKTHKMAEETCEVDSKLKSVSSDHNYFSLMKKDD